MTKRIFRAVLGAAALLGVSALPVKAVSPDMMIAAYNAKGASLQLASRGAAERYADPSAKNAQVHNLLWQRFGQLFPPAYRRLVTEFEIASDGPGNITAYSGLSNQRFGAWVLGVDPADVFPGGRLNKSELDASLIHEFAHIMFQQEGQMRYSRKAFNAMQYGGYQAEVARARAACPTFFTFDACAESNSFLYHYMYSFWQPMLTAWVDTETGGSMAKRQFLARHHGGFVSGYASTHPVEDMVESFTAFVLHDQPAGNNRLADRKVQFFYQYPEMVKLRSYIRARL